VCVRSAQACAADAAVEGGAVADAPAQTFATDGAAAGPVCSVPERGGAYCRALPPLAAEPKIDGVPECGLALEWIKPQLWNGPAALTPSDRVARYAAAWTSKGLYFYVDVLTSHRAPFPDPHKYHCGDAIELFFDDDGFYGDPPAYQNPGTRQVIFAAPEPGEARTNKAWMWVMGTSWIEWTGSFATVGRPDGYSVEAFFKGGDLDLPSWTLASGFHVGLDVAVDLTPEVPFPKTDADYCNRLGQFSLRGADTPTTILTNVPPCFEPWCNVGAFCTSELTDDGVPRVDAAAARDVGPERDASAPDRDAAPEGDDAAP
jgi:hypothetical protein